ncbi:MAG: hypothetical protein JWQ11_2602 [Rhizobacter sp.]|nr:hypothetical protein [Rhizobacter sp.]
MSALFEAHDWAAGPLGAAASWSPSLKALVGVMLASRQPMFMAWGPQRIWLYNDAFILIAGDTHPASLGVPAKQAWAESWAVVGRMFDRVFAGESLYESGFKVTLNRSGRDEDAWFDFSNTPIRDDDGHVIGLYGVCTETTSRVASDRRQLAQAERERIRIFEMSRDLFAVATFDGHLKVINPAWSRQLGVTEEAILARPFADIIHPDDLAETVDVVARLQAGQPVHQFHVRLRKADGSWLALAWSAVPEAEPGSSIFYTVGRDITQETAAAAELLAAQEALRQAQKMEAVGQLTGGLAHDFNNLLMGVSGSLELVDLRIGQGRMSDLKRYIDAAQASLKRAAALTHRLLAFSRRQTLDPKATSVNRLVVGMDDLIRRTVGPSIDVRVHTDPRLWTAMVDAHQLENALLNLCINARDAMPNGGTLTVETSNKAIDERFAVKRSLPAGEYVSLSVTDSGCGMSADTIEHAFEPFFTTKPLGLGTGLGLSMVYGFARQSDGQVRIHSEVDVGTTVSIFLPRHHADEEADAAADVHAVRRAQEQKTVLVVDDEETVRMLVVEVLDELGYTTLEAGDGPEGLQLLASGQRIDLLVTDVGLPGGMNGRQLADAARVSRPSLKVLFITGYAQTAAVGSGRMEPGMQVLTKPFTLESLANRVAELIAV